MVLSDGRRLIVGRDVDVYADRKELMGEAALWGSLSVILFGILGGLLISWITGRRLEAVTGTAREVMGGNLSVRVPLKGTGDDFDQLGRSLNAMLDRNQELVASLGRVSDNIAHGSGAKALRRCGLMCPCGWPARRIAGSLCVGLAPGSTRFTGAIRLGCAPSGWLQG